MCRFIFSRCYVTWNCIRIIFSFVFYHEACALWNSYFSSWYVWLRIVFLLFFTEKRARKSLNQSNACSFITLVSKILAFRLSSCLAYISFSHLKGVLGKMSLLPLCWNLAFGSVYTFGYCRRIVPAPSPIAQSIDLYLVQFYSQLYSSVCLWLNPRTTNGNFWQ